MGKKIVIVLFVLIFLVSLVSAKLEKTKFLAGEIVLIESDGAQVEIISPTNIYRFLDQTDSQIKFIPKEEGIYTLRLSNKGLVEVEEFFVGNIKEIKPTFNIFDSSGRKVNAKIEFKEDILTIGKQSLNKKQEVKLNFEGAVRHIVFNEADLTSFDLGYEELSNGSVKMFWKETKKVFAIDPTKLDFLNATVTAVARGNELYKCKDYNFTEQKCFGEYVKIMDIIPGEEYSFLLTPEDPQYTEQTSSTAGCSCTNSCTTGSGATSQCTATCTDYCTINFNTPPGAISGWLEKVIYDVSIVLATTGTTVTGSHSGKLDKDSTPGNLNEVTIGTSTVITTGTNNVKFTNNNMPDSGGTAFTSSDCATWLSGYCAWNPWLSTALTCQGSRKSCSTTISITLINYTWNYTPDTTAPTITGLNPPTNTYRNTASNTFYYTPNDNLALRNCSIFLNSVRNQTNTTVQKNVATTFTVTNMADNTYSWYIQCYDTSNNQVSSTARNLIVDKTAPTLAYITPTPVNNYFSQTNAIIINFSHTETNPDKRILNWSGTLYKQSYSGSFTNITRSGLSDGTYRYYVYINDSATNSIRLSDRLVTVDTANPSVSLNDPANANWLTYNSIIFNFTPTDNNLKNCSLYTNRTGAFAFEQNVSVLTSGVKNKFNPVTISDGIYKWNVLCFDRARRTGWALANYTIKIDATKPIVTLLGPKNNTYWNATNIINFNYTVTDSNSITNCSFDIRSSSSTQSVQDSTIVKVITQNFTMSLANEKYNWTVWCQDIAGNINNNGYFNLTVDLAQDLVGPVINLNKPDNGNWTNNRNITLIYTPSDQSVINNCSLYLNDILTKTNKTIFNSMKNNFTLYSMSEGYYDWFINCTDNSTGNYESRSLQTFQFVVHTGKPDIQLVYPSDNFNRSKNSINFTWYIFDDYSINNYCDLTVNNSLEVSSLLTLNNTYKNHTVYFSSEGYYYWNLTCRDKAYNYNTSNTRRFLLDYTGPYVQLIKPINGNVSLASQNVLFFTPSENTTGIQSCSLYLDNQFNSSKSVLNNKQNNFTLSFNSGVYSWQVNCTDYMNNMGNSTKWSFTVDTFHPLVENYSAYPQTVNLGETVKFNISAYDNFGISRIIAQVTNPSGSSINYTMTLRSGNTYNLTYTNTNIRGTYTVKFIANDTNTLKTISSDYYFYVRPGMTLDKIYYDRGEPVIITCSGFDPSDNVTLNISDQTGFVQIGLPVNFIVNSTGGFRYVYNLSTSSSIRTGNYTIEAFDTYSVLQKGYSSLYSVRKPKYVKIYDKTRAGTIVTAEINQSGGTNATIVTSGSEDYFLINFSSVVPTTAVISQINTYFLHKETANNAIYIKWRNATSGLWQVVCVINANTAQLVKDTCSLTNYIATANDLNSLGLRYTDNNVYGNPVGTWTTLDFSYLEVAFASLSTDKESYEQAENVTIIGAQWPVSSQITINITRPNSQVSRKNATTDGSGDFTLVYQLLFSDILGRYNITAYETAAPTFKGKAYFNVTRRIPYITTAKNYYGRRETVMINGSKFSYDSNLTLLIYDAKNILRLNITLNTTQKARFYYNYTIPYAYDGYYGLHRIFASDNSYPSLNASITKTFGIIPMKSIRMQNLAPSSVLSSLNTSNNAYANLASYDGTEDYINITFSNFTLRKSLITNLTVYLEHYESKFRNLSLKFWNTTAWVHICNMSYSASETFGSCSFQNKIRAPMLSELTVKITDENQNFGISGNTWTSIDYAYLVAWKENDTKKPNITIASPLPDSVWNYTYPVQISLNATEDVKIDKIYAVIEWPGNSQSSELIAINTNYYSEGYYALNFTNTQYVGFYNITIYSNDTSGNLNITRTNFTILSYPLELSINITPTNRSVRIGWSSVQTAQTYEIYITENLSSGFLGTANYTTTELNWTHGNASLNSRYYYKIAAVRNNNRQYSRLLGKNTRQLYPGWNLISVPFNRTWLLYDGANGEDIFTQPGNCIISLYRRNATNQSYERTDYIAGTWNPGLFDSSDFTHLENGRGYWAETSGYCNMTFVGIVPWLNSTYSLSQSFNVMGQYTGRDQPLYDESIVRIIDTKPQEAVSVILGYDSELDDFKVSVFYSGWGWWPSYNNPDFTYLNSGEAYFFDADTEANWTHDPNRD